MGVSPVATREAYPAGATFSGDSALVFGAGRLAEAAFPAIGSHVKSFSWKNWPALFRPDGA
jgi:hypothetical protein